MDALFSALNSVWVSFVTLVIVLLGFLVPASGCSAVADAFNTGPRAAKNVSDLTETLVIHAVDGLQAQTGQMSADASLSDPEYRMQVTVCPAAVITDVVISMKGLDIEGKLLAGLEKRLENDPTLTNKLIDIINRTELEESEKNRLIVDLIREFISAFEGEEVTNVNTNGT